MILKFFIFSDCIFEFSIVFIYNYLIYQCKARKM